MKRTDITKKYLSAGYSQLRRDLIAAFQRFPISSLYHLAANYHRLIRGHYRVGNGGCIFHILSETLPERLECRSDLINYFTGRPGSDSDAPVYLPAKHVVKAWDGDFSMASTRARYPGVKKLGKCFLRAVLHEAIVIRGGVPPRPALHTHHSETVDINSNTKQPKSSAHKSAKKTPLDEAIRLLAGF